MEKIDFDGRTETMIYKNIPNITSAFRIPLIVNFERYENI